MLGKPRGLLGRGKYPSLPPQTHTRGLREQCRPGPALLTAPGRAAARPLSQHVAPAQSFQKVSPTRTRMSVQARRAAFFSPTPYAVTLTLLPS